MDEAGISDVTKSRGFPREHRYTMIVPYSKWTEDSNNHCLLVVLPGFKEKHICYMNSDGKISIKGSREVNETSSEHFAMFFTLPRNSDASKYTVKFVNEILYVTVPKVEPTNVTVPKVEPKNEGEHGSKKGDGIKHEEGGNIIRTAMEMLNKNKMIVMNAVVAFSLVMLVCRKFQSAGD